MKQLIRRFFGKSKPSRNSEKAGGSTAEPRSSELETLEPRMLFSAAPVDAPDEGNSEPESQEQAAEESVVVVSEQAAQTTAESLAESESTQEGPIALPTGSGQTGVSLNRPVTLLDVTPEASTLNQETLEAVAEAAADRWRATGLTAAQETALDAASYRIADLGIGSLAQFEDNVITVDDDAAASGSWFIDSTLGLDEEFGADGSALAGTAAVGRHDLLAILIHEQGHLLGLDDTPGSGDAMDSFFRRGTRAMLEPDAAAGAVPGSLDGAHYAITDNNSDFAKDQITNTLGFTVNSGTDRLLIVFVAEGAPGALPSITDVSYNGSSLTFLGEAGLPAYDGLEAWYTTLGTGVTDIVSTITVTSPVHPADGFDMVIAAVAYDGVDQGTPIDGFQSFIGGAATTTLTTMVTSEANGDRVVGAGWGFTDPLAVGPDQTVIHNAQTNPTQGVFMSSSEPGTATPVTHSYTGTNGAYPLSLAFNVNTAVAVVASGQIKVESISPAPEVQLSDGDSTPTRIDLGDKEGTHFGSVDTATGSVTRTFRITNSGGADLNLTGPNPVTLTGADASHFSVVQPASLLLGTNVGTDDTTTFTVTYNPTADGHHDGVTLHIASDDPDAAEADFDFALEGIGTTDAISLVTQLGTVGSVGGDEEDTISSFTVAAGNNRLLVVYAFEEDSNTITDVSFDGTSLTLLGGVSGGTGLPADQRLEVWYAPMGSGAALSGDVVMTAHGGADAKGSAVAAVVYQNVDQSSPVDGFDSTFGTVNFSELVIASEAGDLVAGAHFNDSVGNVGVNDPTIPTIGAGTGQATVHDLDVLGNGVAYLHTTTEDGGVAIDTLFDWTNNQDSATLGFNINGVAAPDFGDAPDSYLTLVGSGGASHNIDPDIFMGAAAPDSDSDGFGDGTDDAPTGDAADDDTEGSDDEDGVASFAALTEADSSYSVDVTVTNNQGTGATLFGWIDFDRDGVFQADEGTSVAVADGTSAATATLNWTGLGTTADITDGGTFARFRLTTDGSITTSTPGGAATDGEVEDYALTIDPVDAGSVAGDDVTTLSNFTVSAGSDRLLVVFVAEESGGTFTDVTYDGGSLTRLGGIDDDGSTIFTQFDVWYTHLGAGAGAAISSDIAFTNAATSTDGFVSVISAVAYEGVDSGTPVEGLMTSTPGTTTTVTSGGAAEGDAVVGAAYNSDNALGAGAGQTAIETDNNISGFGFPHFMTSQEVGTGAVTMSYTGTVGGEIETSSLALNINGLLGAVPSTTDITVAGGVLTIGDNNNEDNDFLVTSDGTTLTIEDRNDHLIDLGGLTGGGSGTDTVTINFADNGWTGGITVNGSGGDDSLEIDFTNPNFDNRAFTFNGGDPALPTTPGDSLIITGGSFTTVTHDMTGASSGNFDIDGNIDRISYTGLEPVDMTGSTATDLILNLPAGADNARLRDIDGTPGGNLRLLSTDSPVTFEQTDFAAPTGSLTINGGSDDSLDIFNAITMSADLIVSLGTANVNGAVDVSGATTPLVGIETNNVAIAAMLNAGTGRVEIDPFTAGTNIHLGNTTPAGELNLSDTEIDRVTAGVLQIGDATAGRIQFSGTTNGGLITPANVSTVHLISGSFVTDGANNNTGGGIRVSNLAVEANGANAGDDRAIRLNNTNNGVESQVDTFAASSTDGWIELREDNNTGVPTPGVGLTIGTVDGIVGVTNASNTGDNNRERITINAQQGDVVIDDDMSSRRDLFVRALGNQNQIILNSGVTIGHVEGGTLTLRADNIDLEGNINSPGRIIALMQDDNGNEIHVGTGAVDVLNDDILELDQAELNRITAGTVGIGRHNYGSTDGSGDITVVGTTTLANSNNLRFRTNTTVSQNAGATITENNLGINARGDVTLDEANVIDLNLAIDLRTGAPATSGNIVFRNNDSDAWTINGTAGVGNFLRTDNGDILVTSIGTVNVDESTGNTDIEVEAETIGIGNGDITFNIGAGTTDGRDFQLNDATSGNVDKTNMAADGDININLLGTGDSRVFILDSAQIVAGENISIDVLGSNNNARIVLHGGSVITSGGTTDFVVRSDNGQFITNFDDSLPVTVNSTSGTFTVKADRFIVDANTVFNAAGQRMIVRPFADADNIRPGVGSDATDGNLRISQAEINTITADILQLGDNSTYTGNIIISGDTVVNPVQVETVHLRTAGNVSDDANDHIEVENLAITTTAASGGTVTLDDADTDIDVLAIDAGGAVDVTDIDDIEIGSVDGVSGITTTDDNASITSSGGSITVSNAIGTGAGTVTLNGANDVTISANVTTTGAGAVDVDAVRKILVDSGAIVSTVNGGIDMDANVAGTASGNFFGLYVNGTTIRSTGTGNISLTGSGGDSLNGNLGINVKFGGQVVSTSTGSITLVGTGGNGTGGDLGVAVDLNSKITSVDGDISVTGSGGNGAGSFNVGIILTVNGDVKSTGTGSIAISGTGGVGADSHGVRIPIIFDPGSEVTTASGNISITGESAGSDDILLENTTTGISSASGNITLTADDITIGGNLSSTGGDLLITPRTFSTTIGVGAGATGDLNIDPTEIAFLQDGFNSIAIGAFTSGTGAVDVNSSTFLDPISISGLDISVTELDAGANDVILNARFNDIVDGGDAGTDVTGAHVSLLSAGGIGADGDQVSLAADTLEIPSFWGDTYLSEADTVTLANSLFGFGSVEFQGGGTFELPAGVSVLATEFRVSNGSTLELQSPDGLFAPIPITVENGGTLSGVGTTTEAVTVELGGTIAPGLSPGVIFSGNLDIDGDYDVEVVGFDGAGNVNGHDQTVVTGTVDLDGTTSMLNLDITGLTAAEMNANAGTELVIIDNDDGPDAVIGDFSNFAEGEIVSANIDGTLHDLVITYRGGTGNDVSLIAGNLTTRIFLEGGTDLVIEDINDVTNDQLTVSVSGGNLIITETDTDILIDAQGAFDGATGDLSNSVTIALTTFTGNVILRTVGGDDTMVFENMDLTGTQGLEVEDGAGTDSVTFQGSSSDLNNGDVDVTADSIVVDEDIDAGTNGGVTLIANGTDVTISADVTTAGTGAVVVDAARKILVNSGATVSTVNGGIDMDANAGGVSGNFIGVDVNTGTIQSTGSGTIQIDGTGGDTGSFQYGVRVRGGGDVIGGSSSVTVNGQGGPSDDGNNWGVVIDGAGSTITSTGGNVSVAGTGGGTGIVGGRNVGLILDNGGKISAGGSGTVTVDGTGASNSSLAIGVYVHETNSEITSSGGAITVRGTAGGTGGQANIGVLVQNGGRITGVGSGDVTVDGTGGINGTGVDNDGVLIDSGGSLITSVNGNVTVTGTAGGGVSPFGFEARGGNSVSSSGSGDVTLIADSMSFLGGSSISAAGDTVTLRQETNGTLIDLGGADSAGTLGLTDAELDRVTASRLTVGNSDSGNVTISDSISPGGTATLEIITGGAISETNAGATDITETNVELRAGGGGIGASGGDEISLAAATILTVSTGNQFLSETGSLTINGFDAGASTVTIDVSGEFDLTTDAVANGTSITVEDGATLDVNGAVNTVSFAGVTVEDGGTLKGDGDLGSTTPVTVNDGGTGTPGTSPGVIATGNLTLNSGSTFFVELDGIAGPGAVNGHDQYDVTGSVTIDNATLSLDTIPATYTPVLAGQQFVIINNDGGDAVMTGTFAGLAEGTFVSTDDGGGLPDHIFQITYLGTTGTGNDVVLEATGAVATTNVYLDGSGNLVVEDILGDSTNDNLRIEKVGTDYVIEDLDGNPLGTLIVGATQTSLSRVVVPMSLLGTNGGVIVNTLGGDDTVTIGDLGTLNANGNLSVDGGDDQDSIIQTGDATLTDAGAVDYDAETIYLQDGSSLKTDTGNVDLDGTGATGNAVGVRLRGADITSTSGNVSLTGEGGDGSVYNRGVLLDVSTAGSTISTGGSVTLDGTGGTAGVHATGVTLINSTVESTGAGPVTITGQGGTGTLFSEGVAIHKFSTVDAGTGGLFIDGTGGSSGNMNRGITASNSDFLSNGGNIEIDGTGGGTMMYGVGVELNTIDTATNGAGTVTIRGTGASGTLGNMGVKLASGSVSTVNGAIQILGTANGSTLLNHGVQITTSMEVGATGSGNVTVTGTGGAGTTLNHGVQIATLSSLSVAGGDLMVTGEAKGTVSLNRGVEIIGASTLNATGAGNIFLTGTGSASGAGVFNTGINIAGGGINSVGGNITLNGNGGTGTTLNEGIRIVSATVASTGSGTLSLTGEAQNPGTTGVYNTGMYLLSMSLNSGGTVNVIGTGGAGTLLNHGVYMQNVTTTGTVPVPSGTVGGGSLSLATTGNFFP